eukprot:TRINITY_DN42397_c0_g1_i1.p1 TRINITY_DN42397_c0_g1~~TRINITY_DN42397_c0_g1_i1.p1  ORF type:complete len:245 (-),score=45.71 TRINITY_DN42397_c0_g1_i1:86-820(-)
MDGFALAEYVVPRCGQQQTVPFGTVPKASNEAGSMFNEGKRKAKEPGPEKYHQDILQKGFGSQKAKYGTFSKLAREGIAPNSKKPSPSVGTYESFSHLTSPRLRGGIMAKSPRGCLFYDQAVSESRWKPSPGKYDGKKPEKHLDCPTFYTEIGQSRVPKKAGGLGPGYYTPNYLSTEKKLPAYSSPKEEGGSFTDTQKGKDKVPGPGSNGVPDPKGLDRSGRQKHCRRILGDKIVTPRNYNATV